MNKIILLIVALILSSCALVIPVSKPDLSKSDYNQLVEEGNPKADCYRRGTRIWLVVADFIAFFPMIVDGALGKYTYYYYEPSRCKIQEVTKKTLVVEEE